MGTIERWIHDSTLVELLDFYVQLKKGVISTDAFRWRLLKLNEQEEIMNNPTLRTLRELIKSKLSNDLYYEYVEIYGGENPKTSATDFTTHNEFILAKRRSVELDLEDFFHTQTYVFKENLLDEEKLAEIEDTEVLDKYNADIEFQLKQEMLGLIRKH